MLKKQLLNFVDWGFPEAPVIKTLRFHCKGVGSVPGQGTKPWNMGSIYLVILWKWKSRPREVKNALKVTQ